jgi:outer membrane murein-binding lipoprotein Lpp
VSWFGGDGERAVRPAPDAGPPREPGPPQELPGTIDRLTVSFRELNDKRDRLENDVEKFRRRVAEAEGELEQFEVNQLQLTWHPSQVDKQRLEQYLDKLRTHLGTVSSELDATKTSIGQMRAVLVKQYAAAQGSRRAAEALTVPCPACGQPSVPHRTGTAGRGWRKGWYECPADDCDAAWSARWSGGSHPAVKMTGL